LYPPPPLILRKLLLLLLLVKLDLPVALEEPMALKSDTVVNDNGRGIEDAGLPEKLSLLPRTRTLGRESSGFLPFVSSFTIPTSSELEQAVPALGFSSDTLVLLKYKPRVKDVKQRKKHVK